MALCRPARVLFYLCRLKSTTMRFLKILLIVIGVLLLIGIIMGLTGPKTYQVERTSIISASPDIVWPYTSNAEAFQEWSPFRKMDTTARVEFFWNP